MMKAILVLSTTLTLLVTTLSAFAVPEVIYHGGGVYSQPYNGLYYFNTYPVNTYYYPYNTGYYSEYYGDGKYINSNWHRGGGYKGYHGGGYKGYHGGGDKWGGGGHMRHRH